MKRLVILIAISLFVASMTGTATAQCGHGLKGQMGGPQCGQHGGKGFGGGQCNILGCKDKLELTDDQVAKIKEINFTHQNGMIDLKAELKKAELNLRQAAQADNPSKDAVLAATKKVHGIKGQITEAQVNHRFAVRAVLNAEQIEKWQKCQAECRGSCGGPGGPGMGAGMPCKPGCAGHPGAPCDPSKCTGSGPGPNAPGNSKGI